MTTSSLLPAVLSGALLCASLIVAIGAQNAYVLQQGLRREHVLPVVLVCAGMDAALMSIGVGGVAGAAGAHPLLLDGLAAAGAAFLAAYAWSAARRAWAPAALAVDPTATARPLSRVLAQTLGVTLLNPHVYLDTVLLVGAVGSQQPAAARPAFVLGASLASLLWFAALGYGARLLAPWLRRPGAWRVVEALIALTMAALALQLLLGLVSR